MKRKTINYAHEFFLVNAEYNKVGSFFSARILLRRNVLNARRAH